MKTITYNKLVRDKIPRIIGQSGKSCICETLPDAQYIEMLNKKLLEEVNEYLESGVLEELADIEEVIDLKKRGGPVGFLSGGKDATQGKETEIAETKRQPKDYGLILLGTPVWSSSPTPAIRTYISHNDLSGKKVALFFTSNKDNPKALEKTKALIANSQFIGELSLPQPLKDKEETKKTITAWCQTLPK
jgi:predicted house-cleaning noncanonical NTP pyrophosphatase (MazG superfamily)/flavodoxin